MSSRRRLVPPWLTVPVAAVATVGLATAAGLAAAAASNEADDAAAQLRSDAERARLLVQSRLDETTAVQELLRDAVVGQWPIDADDFAGLTANDNGRDLFEFAQAVSFNRLVPASLRSDYEQSVRETGVEGFTVSPTTTPFDDLVVVEMIEPLDGNESALGFDIGSNTDRRAAVEAARDTGAIIATAPIELVQQERGVLLISAVYDTTDDLVTAPSRRRHFVGVVVTVVRVADVLDDALGRLPRVEVEIYDQGPTVGGPAPTFTDANLVFDSDDERFVTDDGLIADQSERLDLNVGDRRWSMISRQSAEAGATTQGPWWILLGGLALTGAVATTVATVSSARKRAEDLVTRRTADLRSVVQSAPDPTLVVDLDGRIVLASDLVEDLLGHRPDDLIGMPVEHLVPPDLREVHLTHRSSFFSSPTARMMGGSAELHALHADGSLVPVEISLNPLPAHSLGSVVAAIRDVSVQREAVHELERANELKSTFLATVSHELRTPLTAIAGFARLLQSGGADEATNRDFVSRIVSNVDGLELLISEVLEFSRLERSATHLAPSELDAVAQVSSVVDQLGEVLASHQVVVTGGAGDPSARVYADSAALGRMVTNLLTNAVRYSPAGSTITISIEPRGAATAIHVDDEGAGVPEAERPLVFERFWRGQAALTTNAKGTGIGLAVVAELAAMMAGSAEVSESPRGGARFTLVLPAAPTA